MITDNSKHYIRLSVLCATMILAGCGREPPEQLLASARGYLAGNDNRAAVIQIKNALQQNPDLPEGRFLLGKAFLESGDAVAAEVELRKALELKYSSDQTLPLLAKALLAQGKPEKAMEEFAAVDLVAAESRADLRTTLGMAQALLGNADAARGELAKALAAQPGYAPAMIAQAWIKAGDKDYAGAQAMLEAVLAKAPGNHEAWKLKGDLLAAQGAAEAAQSAYRKALEAKPDFVAAHAGVISSLLQEAKLEAAAVQLEAMKQVAPGHSQTLYLEAMIAYQKQDFKLARELVQRLVQRFPDHALGLQLAGAVEFQFNAWGQAETYLAKALQLAPNLALARRLLVMNYLRTDQPAKALTALEPVLKKIDNDAMMLSLAGQVYARNGDLRTADRFFSRAAALDPKDGRKRATLALAHMVEGKTDAAVEELEEIAGSDSGTSADMALIASYLRSKNFDKALQAVAALEKKQPDDPAVHHLRGRILFAKGDSAGARRSLERALSLNPRYFPAVGGLAALDLAEKRPDEARKRLEAVVAGDPKNVQALLGLADVKRQAGGSPEEVAALLIRAVSADPAALAPRLLLVDHYLRQRDTAKALSAAQDAVSALPDRPEALNALGTAQQQAGDLNQALATYGKLAKLRPNLAQPYLRMADIHLAGNNKEEALRSLLKGLELKPDQLEAQRKAILLHMDAGQPEKALALARDVQKQRPKAAIGFQLEGDILAAGKQWAAAEAAYRAGLKLESTSEVAVKLHSVLLQRSAGNTAEADKFASAWQKTHAKDAAFQSHLGDWATARKDYETAARLYRAALEIQPDDARILNNLAWVSGQQKHPQAIEYAEKANRLAPDQPTIMDTLAMLLAQKGDTQRALELLQKAVQLAPRAPLIRLNLAKVLIQAGQKAAARKELEELSKLGEGFSRQAEVAQLLREV